jgi:hypothetical protein
METCSCIVSPRCFGPTAPVISPCVVGVELSGNGSTLLGDSFLLAIVPFPFTRPEYQLFPCSNVN